MALQYVQFYGNYGGYRQDQKKEFAYLNEFLLINIEEYQILINYLANLLKLAGVVNKKLEYIEKIKS